MFSSGVARFFMNFWWTLDQNPEENNLAKQCFQFSSPVTHLLLRKMIVSIETSKVNFWIRIKNFLTTVLLPILMILFKYTYILFIVIFQLIFFFWQYKKTALKPAVLLASFPQVSSLFARCVWLFVNIHELISFILSTDPLFSQYPTERKSEREGIKQLIYYRSSYLCICTSFAYNWSRRCGATLTCATWRYAAAHTQNKRWFYVMSLPKCW